MWVLGLCITAGLAVFGQWVWRVADKADLSLAKCTVLEQIVLHNNFPRLERLEGLHLQEDQR